MNMQVCVAISMGQNVVLAAASAEFLVGGTTIRTPGLRPVTKTLSFMRVFVPAAKTIVHFIHSPRPNR